jgi:hypothetical protein
MAVIEKKQEHSMPYQWLVTAVRPDTFLFIITGATTGRRDWAGKQGMRGKQVRVDDEFILPSE